MFKLDGEATPAGLLKVGDKLVGENNKIIRVKRIWSENVDGFVAPLTASGTVLVEGVVSSARALGNFVFANLSGTFHISDNRNCSFRLETTENVAN